MVKEENIDLLIMSAHEEGHIEHFLFGRDNEELIRRMPCSVMLVKNEYEYHLDLEAVARIWRGGCIVRVALLGDICAAFHARRDLPNLLLDPNLSCKVMEHQEDLRQVVCRAAESGVPAPGLMVALGYLDAYRSVWLPANLIQARSDYFGAHTYERVDAKGTFHTEWEKR